MSPPAASRPLLPSQPDRETRVRAILDHAIPRSVTVGAGFNDVIDRVLEHTWQKSVVARATRVAPGIVSTSFFTAKLRAGFSVYCALGISAIACSTSRPPWLTLSTSTARVLGLGGPSIEAFARRAMPLAFRGFCARELDLIAVASALVLVLDFIFDDELGDLEPEERIAAVARVVDSVPGQPGHASDAGVLASVLVDDLRRSGPGRWPKMAQSLVEWARAEIKLEQGDAEIAPRKEGIEQSMALLAFGVPRFVGERELRWMQDIALLGQMVDDVLDLEKDLATGRITPAATGQWNVEGIGALHRKLIADTRALVVDAGERHEPTLALYESTVRGQLRHMAEVLVAHP